MVDAAASAERAGGWAVQTFTQVGGAIVHALLVISAGAGGLALGFLASAGVLFARRSPRSRYVARPA